MDSYYLNKGSLGHFINTLKYTAGVCQDMVLIKYLEELRTGEKLRKTGFVSQRFISLLCEKMKTYALSSIRKSINEHNGGYYGIMIDSTTDISSQNQLTVVLRWVNKKLEVFNATVAMLPLIKCSGKDYFEKVREVIQGLGLDIRNAYASSTDGAKNMLCGFLPELEKVAHRHINTYCCSHRLNLCISLPMKKLAFPQKLWKTVNCVAKRFKRSYKKLNDWKCIIAEMNQRYKDINTQNTQNTKLSVKLGGLECGKV